MWDLKLNVTSKYANVNGPISSLTYSSNGKFLAVGIGGEFCGRHLRRGSGTVNENIL